MIRTDHFTSVFLIFIVSSSLINVSQSSEAGNWLTKSLDYYSLEKCSPLDKSGIAGDFYDCLNSPNDKSNGQSKSGYSDWGKFGSNGPAGVGGGLGELGSSGGFSGQSGFDSSQSSQPQTTSPDSWPLSLVKDLKLMINCFPKLLKPCMTESEIQFFTTIKDLFQAQVDYASPNASLIATTIDSTGCARNTIDSNTICYSTNVHNQNWFGWQINWIDGQMCRFIDDISKCEISSFDKCPTDVRQFVDGLWESGLRVTPCLNLIVEVTTSSPLPVTTDDVDQTKSLALGSSIKQVDSNQLPPRLTNVTNINSNDKQSLEVTVNNLTINNNAVESVAQQKQKDNGRNTLLLPQRSDRTFSGKSNNNNNNNAFDGLDKQLDVTDEIVENKLDINEKTRDFEGGIKHSKLVRLHEIDGEGESRHDHDKKHRDVAEEQWSRIKEEFRRKMRESIESRESDESEYEEESEESNEDKNFEIFENRKNPFGFRQRNEEDDYIDNRKNILDSLGNRGERQKRRREEKEKFRQLQRNEAESRRRRVKEEEEEERRRETEQRRKEEDEQRSKKERDDDRRMNEEANGWEDEKEMMIRPERHLERTFRVNRWDSNNNQQDYGNEKGSDSGEYDPMRSCFESTSNSWPSQNHNSFDMMDLMCRNMNSIYSCLEKHSTTKTNGQANRLGHLKMIYQTLCDTNNKSKGIQSIEKVRKCLTDHSPSSGSIFQTKHSNRFFSRF